MKITTVIDPFAEEEIVIRLRKESSLPQRIAALTENLCNELLGYAEGRIVRLSPADLFYVTVEGGRVLASTATECYTLKIRLYEAEALLGNEFVRINQSCLVRMDAIACFETTLGGSLRVRLKNGFCDYVSRRQLKAVKERVGLKK